MKRPEINSGSMADIAFLLLIFFLVATTIDQDKGLLRKLPRISETPPVNVHQRNVLSVYLNANNLIMVNDIATEIQDLKGKVTQFVSNNGVINSFSESPKKAIVSIKSSEGTSYNTYVQVQDQIAMAYREMRDAESMQRFGLSFSEIENKQERQLIKNLYPMNISEAGLAN